MKKILMATFSIAMLCAGIASCKKGENDPFLSMRTRKARIAGEWKMTKADITKKYVSSQPDYSLTDVTSYDGTTATHTTTTVSSGASNTTTSTETYTIDFTFEKDGTYKQVEVHDGNTTTTEGTWIFLKRSKENELKNKEAILLTETSTTNSAGGSTVTTSGFDGQIFVIDQLKNNEMIWKVSTSQAGGTTSQSGDATYTLTND